MDNGIGVILVNYNGLQDTFDCIDSLKKTGENLQIIVVDNNSPSNDAELLLNKYKNDESIIILKSEKNLGFSGGNNIGIRYAIDAGCEYVVLLNNDTVVDKDMFTLLKEVADENSVAVPLMYYYSSPDTIWFGGGKLSRFTGNGKSVNKGVVDNGKLYKGHTICTFATGCCLMIHVDVIKKVGLLNELYFMYCEDTEYCIRLLLEKIKIVLVPNAKLWHKVSQSTGGDESAFSLYYINRNRLNYVKRYRRFFFISAYPFSVASRYVRMYQKYKAADIKWKSIYKAIRDHRAGVWGETNSIC